MKIKAVRMRQSKNSAKKLDNSFMFGIVKFEFPYRIANRGKPDTKVIRALLDLQPNKHQLTYPSKWDYAI